MRFIIRASKPTRPGAIRSIATVAVLMICASRAAAQVPAAAPPAPVKPDAASSGCVGEIEELKPEPIPPEERAIEQEEACVEILKKEALAKGCPGGGDAFKFCSDPLGPTVVSGGDLLRVRDVVDRGGCAKSILPGGGSGGVRPQSFVPASLQDELLRGLAQFVVARAKAEAMAFLIGVLKKNVCSHADARDLAVHTCDLLDSSDPDKGTPPAWGSIKSAFEADVEVLPERAVACAAHDASPQVRDLLVTAVQAAMLVRGGDDPVEVLGGLVPRFPFESTKCAAGDLDCGLHMLGFAVRVFAPSKGTDDENAPKAPKDRLLFAEIAARRLVEEARRVGLFTDALATVDWATVRDRLQRLESRIVSLAQAVRAARSAPQQASAANASPESGLRLARAIVGVLDAAIDLVPAHYLGAPPDTMHRYLKIVDELAAAVDAAFTRDYATTFVHVTSSLAAAAAARLGAKPLGKLPDAWARYGPFIAEVAAAKSADDVQHALEAAAAPVGAGLAKRGEGRSTIAVTAFLGLHGGPELTAVSNGHTVSGWQASLFAPVGIDVSWGGGESQSYGVFFSVIDLGALASLRTSDDVPADGNIMAGAKVETAPQVGFRQVLAPGAYFVWGIGRGAIGIGGSVTPELRGISKDGTLIEHDAALRLGVFAAIDVTLFPF